MEDGHRVEEQEGGRQQYRDEGCGEVCGEQPHGELGVVQVHDEVPGELFHGEHDEQVLNEVHGSHDEPL